MKTKYLIILGVAMIICFAIFAYQFTSSVDTFIVINETQVSENGTITGYLMDAYARGVENKTITYHQAGDNQSQRVSVMTGPNGIFKIENVKNVKLGLPIPINIENGVAAMAMAQLNGCTPEELRYGMATWKGVDRRFDFRLKDERHVLISDYAHHPKEILESARSIRQIYKNRKITVIFQPHLYTRTRDFYREFADALSLLDEVILCDIYPAREEPIPGITSKIIYDHLREGVEKSLVSLDGVIPLVKSRDFDVLVILGAGDLDNFVPEIGALLSEK